ncbi:MAG: DUF1285 domain-containing protein [Deltaproteobacteria bacterium]|nr:DUF1285 domain-containing protein [Deltaproteobacteria bacterium]
MTRPVDVTGHPLAGNFRIDKNGVWFHDDEEVTHERTWKYLSGSLNVDDGGQVYLTDGKVRIDVEVEDAPLVVTALRATPDGVRLRLHDDTYANLDPATIAFKANTPYCAARNGLTAKFSTAAYMQLAEYIEEDGDAYTLVLGGKRYPLPIQRS